MRLPDFLVIGPPRTGTTWLDAVLRGRVGLPYHVKETHFFARNYQRGLAWYGSHFLHCGATPVVGEVCAAYFESPQARERIRTHLPQCKIIITLREPVERLYSYYKLMRHSGKTGLPFEEALVQHKQMLACSHYAQHVRDWRTDFGTDNVLVVFNDDLIRDPEHYLNTITDFIGIARIPLAEAVPTRRKPSNTIEVAPRSVRLARSARRFRFWLGSRRMYRTRRLLTKAGVWRFCFGGGAAFPPLDPAVSWRLRELLRPQVEQLESLLERDLSAWKNPFTQASRPAAKDRIPTE